MKFNAVLFFLFAMTFITYGQNKYEPAKSGENSMTDARKMGILSGNNITTSVFNYGAVSPGNGLIRHDHNFVWNELGYMYQTVSYIGASVPDPGNDSTRLYIVSDAINEYEGMYEVNPDDPDDLWQFNPLPGYSDPTLNEMAVFPDVDSTGDGKPDSWPESWYRSYTGAFEFPLDLPAGALQPSAAAMWVMDDRDNAEFNYYPFINDSSRRGLGIRIEGRAYQWDHEKLRDGLLLNYKITNVSDKDLDTVVFGIYADLDIGGGPPENSDDNALLSEENIALFWDQDSLGDFGKPTGTVGVSFLSSPGNKTDGIDNDNDGLTDESQTDGIDNDNDWNPATDDVGIDGLPNTNDEGEGDGIPTGGKFEADGTPKLFASGEPNYELNDPDESDGQGLTSFYAGEWRVGIELPNDKSVWNVSSPGVNYPHMMADIVSCLGTGFFRLNKGETKTASVLINIASSKEEVAGTKAVFQRFVNSGYASTSVKVEESPDKPTGYFLGANYPNPFNPSTKIRYSLPEQAKVSLKVYDALGQEVASLVDKTQNAGKYEINFDATSLAGGVYFYRLTAGSFIQSRKMILLK